MLIEERRGRGLSGGRASAAEGKKGGKRLSAAEGKRREGGATRMSVGKRETQELLGA